ncbi:MAG: CBS domain-containing protein [Planctomycetota bacterium]
MEQIPPSKLTDTGVFRAISSYTPRLREESADLQYPTVRDFMDTAFVKLLPDTNVYEAIDILVRKDTTGAAVVTTEGELVGILTEKDCLRTMLRGAYDGLPGGTVADYMSKRVTFISPDVDVIAVANIFMEKSYRRLPVVEEERVVGEISRRDLLRAVQQIAKDSKNGPIY